MVTALLVLAGVVVTALGGWFVARRLNSGKINTSEAKDLWAESSGIRIELRAELAARDLIIEHLNAQIMDLNVEVRAGVMRSNGFENQLITALADLKVALSRLAFLDGRTEGVLVSTAGINGKLDVLHSMGNSALTESKTAELHATERELVLMRVVAAGAAGPQSDDAQETIKKTEDRITELGEQLAARASQQQIIDAKLLANPAAAFPAATTENPR